MANTSMGMDERLQGMLGYLVPVVLPIIWLAMEKQNRFVRFHAAQSLLVFVAFAIISIARWLVVSVLAILPIIGGILGGLVTVIITVAMLGIWVLLMVRTVQGETFRLPLISDMCDHFVG